MNIIDIDVVSFAGRVAHVAAAELYGLLSTGEIGPIPTWFDPDGALRDAEAIGEKVETMAAYCLRRICAGETLFRAHAAGDWADQDLALQLSFNLFASTVAGVGSKLLDEQRAAEKAAEMAARAKPAGLKREDSIFEEEDGLGDLRPEAVAASRQVAAYEKAKKEEAQLQRRLEAARRHKEREDRAVRGISADLDAARKDLAKTLVDGAPPSSPAPLSIGETPAKPPVNRGGRGKKKR